MKRRISQNLRKAAKQRYALQCDAEFKAGMDRRRYGTIGLASQVRHIDPATYSPAAPSAEPVETEGVGT